MVAWHKRPKQSQTLSRQFLRVPTSGRRFNMKRSQKNWSRAVHLFAWLFAVAIIATAVAFVIFLWAVSQLLTFEEATYLFPELERNARVATVIATLIWFISLFCGCLICGGIYFAANGKFWELIEVEIKEDLEDEEV